ncbi:ImmA/IrrE family metallo-endopeptidase [Paenibacillus paeoniae]|uniref:ImmA/IrrE family metallo-endopeptidase n=1 Tax=Paenibacillus paeoniae TaxID=2292705 RepID=A0A371PG54_9BACL|nr:ImmA/IrrE family metallo-endopeptidase [Paenibacillus paeoniae]REK74380.1 ImmA/IrrE family metallo-endopeptidase [Paenibacillus paeoniae]
MELLNFELYRPTAMELWIQAKFKEGGILVPGDLEDLDHIASLFDAFIAYTEGETKVLYDEDGDCLIFLNIHLDRYEQRLAFFHELCHPAMHAGNQRELPPSFVSLQETQAGLFQLYSAMPVHMLQDAAAIPQQPSCYRQIAEAFGVPAAFAQARLERISRRVNQERRDRNMRARLAAQPPCDQGYSEATTKLLRQLQQQTYMKKGATH